jgi:glyoxylase-like metal-dependent hydrolase (beta-lactamase superfamily II)
MAGTAQVFVLHEGYAREEDDADRVGSTVTLIVDGGRVIVVDPGMVSGRDALLGALAARGPDPAEVTDVVFSHHHPDHTINAALFRQARIHDFWATYVDDEWISRDFPDGVESLSPSVQLMLTPGHSPQDLSTVVQTDAGVVVCTHAWWTAEGPAEDPYAEDTAQLRASRQRVLDLGPALVVPGHGAPFAPGESTPL